MGLELGFDRFGTLHGSEGLTLGIDVDEDVRDARWIRFGLIVLERVEVVEVRHIALDLDGFAACLSREKTNSLKAGLRRERHSVFLDVEFGLGHA